MNYFEILNERKIILAENKNTNEVYEKVKGKVSFPKTSSNEVYQKANGTVSFPSTSDSNSTQTNSYPSSGSNTQTSSNSYQSNLGTGQNQGITYQSASNNNYHKSKKSPIQIIITVIIAILLIIIVLIASGIIQRLVKKLDGHETQTTNTAAMTSSHLDINIIDLEEYNEHLYILYDDEKIDSWNKADEYCKSIGGYLATINDSKENEILFNLISRNNYENVYFGYSNDNKNNIWRWTSGEVSSYENWADGEPNEESQNEKYAMFYTKYKDGKWNDGEFSGTGNDRAFLCECENYTLTRK